MTSHALVDPDTEYAGTVLHGRRYQRSKFATRPDDGIIDPVAVARRLGGQPVPLSGREIVAAVALAATRELATCETAARLNITTDAVEKIRSRAGIASPAAPGARCITRDGRTNDTRPRRHASGFRAFALNEPLPIVAFNAWDAPMQLGTPRQAYA